MPGSILLIDDDSALLRLHSRFFQREGWEVYTATSGEEGLELFQAYGPDLVLLDLHLPMMSGLNVLEVLSARGATVILLTGHGEIETAVEAMRMGAENFLIKPVALPHLAAMVERAMEKVSLRRANEMLAQSWAEGHGLLKLGTSPKMRELARQIELLAASDSATVLLLGESGTGKGWVAQTIHAHSARARGAFVEVNCAGLSASLLDSELFGHEKGAFTDAKSMKRGLFEIAHGGTLFLDEVGDLAPELQPKLLKVLERKVFRRVGGTHEIEVDVRLIAATNKDLEAEVAKGRFRADLFYRLNVLPMTLPPLRERGLEDIVALIHRLLEDVARQQKRSPCRLADQTLSLLVKYEWPGNVRQLRNVLERAVILSTGSDEIRPEHLPEELRTSEMRWAGWSPGSGAALTLDEVERRHMERVLSMVDGNRTKAAKVLGISRATLHNKIRKYGLAER